MGLKVTAKGKEPPKELKDGQNFMLYSCISKNWYPTDVKIWGGARENLLKMCILVLNDFIQAEKNGKSNAKPSFFISVVHHFQYVFFYSYSQGKRGLGFSLSMPYQPLSKSPIWLFSPSPLKMKVRLMTQLTKKQYRKSEGYLYTWHVLFL